MKLLNTPIPVEAMFTAHGDIWPLSFTYNKREYKVTSLKWWKYTAPIMSDKASRLYSVCVGEQIAELELLIQEGKWILVKIG